MSCDATLSWSPRSDWSLSPSLRSPATSTCRKAHSAPLSLRRTEAKQSGEVFSSGLWCDRAPRASRIQAISREIGHYAASPDAASPCLSVSVTTLPPTAIERIEAHLLNSYGGDLAALRPFLLTAKAGWRQRLEIAQRLIDQELLHFFQEALEEPQSDQAEAREKLWDAVQRARRFLLNPCVGLEHLCQRWRWAKRLLMDRWMDCFAPSPILTSTASEERISMRVPSSGTLGVVAPFLLAQGIALQLHRRMRDCKNSREACKEGEVLPTEEVSRWKAWMNHCVQDDILLVLEGFSSRYCSAFKEAYFQPMCWDTKIGIIELLLSACVEHGAVDKVIDFLRQRVGWDPLIVQYLWESIPTVVSQLNEQGKMEKAAECIRLFHRQEDAKTYELISQLAEFQVRRGHADNAVRWVNEEMERLPMQTPPSLVCRVLCRTAVACSASSDKGSTVADLFNRARRIAESTEGEEGNEARADVALRLAQAGRLDEALHVASSYPESLRVKTFSSIVSCVMKVKQIEPSRAIELLEQALRWTDALPFLRCYLWGQLSLVCDLQGQPEKARGFLSRFSEAVNEVSKAADPQEMEELLMTLNGLMEDLSFYREERRRHAAQQEGYTEELSSVMRSLRDTYHALRERLDAS